MRTLLSGLIRNHAFGAKGAAGAAAKRPPAGRWNPITSPAPAAAVVSRNSRRETFDEGALISRSLRGAMDGRPDALVGAAAADVRHRLVDVRVGRVRLLGEQRRGGHDLPRLAVAALRHVLRDPGPLDRVRAVLGQAFDGRDALVGDRGDGQHAGAGRDAVQVHGTGAALCNAAAELRAREPECIAQHPEERRVGRDVDRFALAVDGKADRGHELILISGNGDNVHRRTGGGKGAPRLATSSWLWRGRARMRGRTPTSKRADELHFSPVTTYARRLGLFSATMAVMGGII